MAVLDNYLSINQLADEVGVTIRTLHRWHDLRIGPPRTKIGSRVFYSKDDIETWLRSRNEVLISTRKVRTA